MKRFFAFLLFLCFPLLAVANGSYTPGKVTITVSTAGSITTSTIVGDFNVRYNPAVSQGFIFLGGNEGASIAVTGQDSSTGNTFFCYVSPTDALYPAAEHALYMATNGMELTAAYLVSANNLKCTSIGLSADSRRLD